MAFTYAAGSGNDRDRIRTETGDTVEARVQFTDEELDDFLVLEGTDWEKAAAHALEALANRFAREYSFTADGASFNKGSVVGELRKQASLLRNRADPGDTIAVTLEDGYSDDIRSNETDIYLLR